jgi:hypothetical protein
MRRSMVWAGCVRDSAGHRHGAPAE